MSICRHLGAFAAALVLSAATSDAATFNFTLGSAPGTFEAPVGGGAISAFSVSLGGVVFDLPSLGADAPVYNPILNTLTGVFDVEFRGAGQPSASVFNTVAGGICGVGECVLQLFDTLGGTVPPEFLAFNTVTFENVAFGHYAIDPAPVPLPATLGLAAAAFGGLGLAGRRRRAIR